MTQKGDLVTLNNNKEYVCFEAITYNNKRYLYLISNFKPIEIFFANEIIENGQAKLIIVSDAKEKKDLYNLLVNNK